MTAETPPTRPPPRPRAGWHALPWAGLLGAVAAVGVVYAMQGMGKNGPVACAGATAAVARLDPFVHGEVAALNLARPTRLVPALAFNGPDGQPTTLAAFKGRTVLLNLWATWCVPCRKEMPALDKLQGKLGGADFQVVAVNVDQAHLDRPMAFLKDTGIANLPFYADPTFDVFQVLHKDGAALGLPTTLLIDPNGCALGVMAGPAAWDSQEAEDLINAARVTKPL